MDLLFLIHNGRTIRGGTYSIFKFAEYLAKRGQKVTIMCNFFPKFWVNNPLPNSLEVHIVPHIRWKFKGIGKIDSIMENVYYNLMGESHFTEIDFIIGHQLVSGIRAYRLGREYHIPIVTFVFESPEWLQFTYWKQIDEDKNRSKYLNKWKRFQEAMNNSKVVIANSVKTSEMTKKSLDNSIDIRVVYPGIPDIISIHDKRKKEQIIYVGALSNAKNVDEIIKAMSFIRNPPRLIICGDGYKKSSLKSLVNKLNVNCEFRGVITDKEKWKLISESKLMVFPSSFEGFGMPPMEALACGVPCICSDIPILREVYEDKVEYFEEHNVNQLTREIRYLLDNPDYCEKRGKEGQKYVGEKFNWEKSAEKIDEVMRKYL